MYVDEGPTLKRWQQRARGRVNQILKRTCHITIKLDQLEKPPGTRRREGGAVPKKAESPAKRRAKPAARQRPEGSFGDRVLPAPQRIGSRRVR